MANGKQLSKKQLAVIEDMLSGELDEQAILDKHKVRRNIYNKWLADENFGRQLAERIAWLNRQSEIIIARYAPLAASKLVQLTESENQETSRKACLDILSLPKLAAKRTSDPGGPETIDAQPAEQLSEQTVSKLLAALAESKAK